MVRSRVDYFAISISVLETHVGFLPFDIYVKRGDTSYTKLFKKGEELDYDRIERYKNEKHIDDFFINNEDLKRYLISVDMLANKLYANPTKTDPEKLKEVTKEMIELTMYELMLQKNVDKTSVAYASKVAKQCVDLFARSPRSIIQLIKVFNQHPYSVAHSIQTAIYSVLLAKAAGLTSQRTMNALTMGALLHDIGMSKLAFDVEDKDDLTPTEMREVRRHPEIGKRILDNLDDIPSEVKLIVMQHHEQPNGAGYPNHLTKNRIYMLTYIVAIADSFSALTSKRPYREKPFPVEQALDIMSEDIGKFDKKLMAIFRGIFQKKDESKAA